MAYCKYRDKRFAYTSVLAAVTESKRICHAIREAGLRILLAGLQMVLMGRFCKFQNTKPWIAICKLRRGKPCKVQVQIVSRWLRIPVRQKTSLRCGGWFAVIKVKRICHTLRISQWSINFSRYHRKPKLAQAGKWIWKSLLQPNGPLVWAEKRWRRRSHGAVFAPSRAAGVGVGLP